MVGWISSRGGLGFVGDGVGGGACGCCLHVLCVKCLHRQYVQLATYERIGSLASQAN